MNPDKLEKLAPEILEALVFKAYWISAGMDKSAAMMALAEKLRAAMADRPEVKVYQCPRCATAMEVDPTAAPSDRQKQPEGKVVPVDELKRVYLHAYSVGFSGATKDGAQRGSLSKHENGLIAVAALFGAAPNNAETTPDYRQIALDLLHGDEAHLAAIVDGSATADDTEPASAEPQMTSERFRSRNAAHAELLQIHRICMGVANCPPATDGDTLTVRYVKDLAAIVNRLSVLARETNEPRPCCGEYLDCERPCVPRGRKEVQYSVLSWLGYWIDKIPSEAVTVLQDILDVSNNEPNAAAAQAEGDLMESSTTNPTEHPASAAVPYHLSSAEQYVIRNTMLKAAAPALAPLDPNERAARLSLPVAPDVLCSAMQDVVHKTPATPSKLPLSADDILALRAQGETCSDNLDMLCDQALIAIDQEAKITELEARCRMVFEQHDGTKASVADLCGMKQRIADQSAQISELESPENPNATWLTAAHCICSDSGITHGHISQRLTDLATYIVSLQEAERELAELKARMK